MLRKVVPLAFCIALVSSAVIERKESKTKSTTVLSSTTTTDSISTVPTSSSTSGPSNLNPNCAAPGGNFDLTKYTLQLPTGPSETKVDEISSSELGKDCNTGFKDAKYFFTSKEDGAMVMTVPGSPEKTHCSHTPNSEHCRTELREVQPASWDPNAQTNRLKATLVVKDAGDSTVIGQIHIADDDDSKSTKPVCELFCDKAGNLKMGVEETVKGNLKYTDLGNVAIGTKFSYEIAFEGGKLSVIVNGKETSLPLYQLGTPKSYFKAGNYNQGDAASEIWFYELSIEH
jgi:hypothetical protein